MIGNILVGVACVVIVFGAMVARRPSAYHVERRIEIAAPAGLVFGFLDDLRRFAGVFVLFGKPWEKADPGMQKTFEGPATGAGQSLAWSGNQEVGTGKLTIEESVSGRKVRMKLEFVKPMASTASLVLTLADTPAGSTVTWSMDGNHNFIGKAFGVFMNMDDMLGRDIEKALAQLKTLAESPAAPRA